MEFKNYLTKVKQEDIKTDGRFSGYASDFSDEPDLGGDIVKTGAFAKTIKQGGVFGTGIKLLWAHDRDNPIGIWEQLNEDKKGLFVNGFLPLENQEAHDKYILLKHGVIDGMSIGYDPIEHEPIKRNDHEYRWLKEIGLYEISLVTFPMNTRARVTDVKTAIQNSKTPRDLENSLCDAGLSRKCAKYITGLLKPTLWDVKKESLKSILNSLKQTNADLYVNWLIKHSENKVEPEEDETEDEYMERCMGSEEMNSEFPDQSQRAAVCHSKWRKR